ncbi:MAG: hypothetical protein FWC97_06990 [Treponema sp.]|nr:hypothetical protein [Treponema sp.]
MKKTYAKKLFLLFILLSFVLTTCGIGQFFFIPQVPENRINHTEVNVRVHMDLPTIIAPAIGYVIFYRIYLSDHFTSADLRDSGPERILVNPALNADFNHFFPFVDPANQTNFPNLRTFELRNYFTLEWSVGAATNSLLPAGTFYIDFSYIDGRHPTLQQVNSVGAPISPERVLLRYISSLFESEPDRYFLHTPEMAEELDHPNRVNSDVVFPSAAADPATLRHAYVSMYIVAIGTNPIDFSTIMSKATHLGIFKLPSAF